MKIVSLNKNEKIDREKFNFLYRKDKKLKHSIVPVSFIDNTYYLLGNFYCDTSKYLLIEDVRDFHKCLMFAIDFFDQRLNIIELSNIYKIITENALTLSNFNIFRENGIVSKENFFVLEKLYFLPEPLKRYIADKDIPIKVLFLLVKFDKVVIDKISNLIEENPLSVSNFRNLINDIYNFYEKIDYKKPLISEIDRCKKEIKNRYDELNKKIDNILQLGGDIKFLNENFFELCNFNVSFEIRSYEDFCKKTEKLLEKKGRVREVFSLLKEYDLC